MKLSVKVLRQKIREMQVGNHFGVACVSQQKVLVLLNEQEKELLDRIPEDITVQVNMGLFIKELIGDSMTKKTDYSSMVPEENEED